MANDATRRAGERMTLTILIVFCALGFGWVIAAGWARFISQFSPSAFAQTVAGGVFALVALLSAAMIGYSVHARRTAEHENRPNLFGMVVLSALLLAISFFGTVNALIFYTQGKEVMQEQVEAARDTLTRLEAAAQAGLRDTEHESRRAAVDTALSSLRQEIIHPRRGSNCGQGRQAAIIIADLARQLPGYRTLSWTATGQDCDIEAATALYNSYERQARELLANEPGYVARGGPSRQAYLDGLAQSLEADRTRLATALTTLNERGASATDTVREALEAVNTNYMAQRSNLAIRAPTAATDLPASVDTMRGFGSWSDILATLWNRADRGGTIFCILVALLVDLSLVALFAWHASLAGGQRRQATLRGDGPHFLWVNRVGA